MVNAMVATRRLAKFFTHFEIDTDDHYTMSDIEDYRCLEVTYTNKNFQSSEADEESLIVETVTGTQDDTNQTAIKICTGNFTWDSKSTHPIIQNIDIDIKAGSLIMIVGAVGSGKSSLLSAIIGEMMSLNGKIDVKSKHGKYNGVAYSAQTAWIVNASLKDNILFGKPYEETRYTQVIAACALQPDIDILPAGDLTEIGEKGINLSGGQKQRVSVARAMYSDKDIVLLDDPLSALDIHVGSHLFKEGIMGLIRNNKTVVLVTHHLQFLQYADDILVMENGTIIHNGTFEDICASDPNLFANWKMPTVESEMSGPESDNKEERNALMKQVGQTDLVGDGDKEGNQNQELSTGQLIKAEEREKGAVSYRVYKYFLMSMGWRIITLVLCLRVIQEIVSLSRIFWLANWAEAGDFSANITTNLTREVDNRYYIAGYGWLTLATVVTTAMFVFCGVYAMYMAARNIHFDMIRNIFGSPLRFFDTTPGGRILNRLSSDTQIVDFKLLVTLISVLYFVVGLLLGLIAIVIVQPIFLLEIVPVIIGFVFVERYFIASSRELRRLDSITKSPVFAHFSETLGGLPTIRAYKAQNRLFVELLKRIDTNNTAYLHLSACNGWVGTMLTFLAILIKIMASFTAVILAERSELSSSYVGLVLAFAFSVPYLLRELVKFSAEIEIQMNAVERIHHYTELPNETKEGKEPPLSWPQKGEIKIEDIHARYAASLPCILKSVNLNIKPGEKIGVCGRTGSGKSSLTLALLRMIDTYKGRIVIDGEDIAELPLRTLRRRLSIIAQEPILFTGTIRDNIDPEGVKSDTELWDALEMAQLKGVVTELDEGLDYEVSEGGENFSVGQRQLFCFVRAFLRNSRILIMDEATASIDYDTELILQELVKSHFVDKTVITIAHRVSTILKSDSVVVLSEGEIVEHDTPANLLANQSTIFASLVQANQ
ncbi:ATP-binding cassette sub-family C member 9-like [Amphiura filiformis]|uniref:ATP-binding cassette sub-family C member 9-like n=1 Tax=Amphiura filiformis TaxID=82378 RepID=UPI003B216CF4